MVSAEISSTYDAVSHIVSNSSDKVVVIQPALSVPTRFSGLGTVLTENSDPFSKIADLVSLSPSSSITVTCSLDSLFSSISHLGSLAKHPVVIHVDVGLFSDYGKLAALRHSPFVFLQSFSCTDAQDVALAAHLISLRSQKPVVHFFAESWGIPTQPIGFQQIENALQEFQPEEDNEDKETNQEQLNSIVTNALNTVSSITKRPLNPFEYYGPTNATSAIVLFSSSNVPFVEALSRSADSKTGLALIRVYRPWSTEDLLNAIPQTVEKLALVEQIQTQTTAWSPLVQDFIADLQLDNSKESKRSVLPTLVAFRLGGVNYDNVRTALSAISANLNAQNPIQNLYIGSKQDNQSGKDHKNRQASAIKSARTLEQAYTKVLDQLFGDRVQVLNQSENDDTLESTPEYGYGKFLAEKDKRSGLFNKVQLSLKANDFPVESKDKLNDILSKWVLQARSQTSIQDKPELKDLGDSVIEALHQAQSSVFAQSLLKLKDSFKFRSPWLIGSDAWSYDLGNSGVHNVISSGKNINMLIIDSQPFSSIDKTDPLQTRKKDIGLYAMNFGNVYVASVAVYSSYTQLLQALLEAEKFDGPSVVLAYLPYNSETDTALTVLQETKKAVESGYWPLYRYNPLLLEEESFKLDSSVIRKQLRDFLDRENKLTLLSRRNPVFAKSLESSYGTGVRNAQLRKAKDAFTKLLEGLSGPPLTILFASDGGNAESLAKRLQRRAKGRGLKAIVLAMDDYPVEDLSNEENIVLITSTAGQGELPQNGRNFWDAVKNSTDIDLAGVNYSVFGLGDSHYWPRKEDKIYYNKPSRDLDNRLQVLGASHLVPIGLGDDQDADGFQTGYLQWETLLWTALGVDGVAGIDEPPPITNEDIKIGSNYLRGTIVEGLADPSTGAISAPDQQVTKFHGIYMQDDRDIRDERKAAGLEPAFSFMVRVRLPGCVATPEQWLKIDELSDSRGNGTFKITTRGTFQLHGVIKKDLKPAIRGINSSLIDTVAACGDVDRNVVASALPGNKKIHDEVVKIAKQISEHLLPQTTAYHEIWLEGQDEGDGPDYEKTFASRKEGPKKTKTLVSGSTLVDHEPLYGPTYLPRKFKINIAVPPHNDVDVYGHDIGLIAIVDDNELTGFNVLAGGGMGVTHNNKKTYPRTGSLLGYVSKDKIYETCEKIMLVQRDNGDRSNRKHARLKYTIDDLGVDVYRSKTEELLGYKFEEPKPFSFDANIDQFGWTTDETGRHHFTTFVENGRVEDTPELRFKTGFKEIAKVLKGVPDAEFRLTANQHILISNIDEEHLPVVKKLLTEYKLDNLAFSGLRLSSAACVAFPTCGLAMAESERYLPVLISKVEEALEEYGLRHDSIVMRMTGCPNGCARPWLAEVGLVGKAYGAYNLLLGGGHHGQRLNKLYRSSLKEEEILSTLKPLFKSWALERNDGEPFGDYLIRSGVIAETTEGKNFWENVPEDEA